MATISERVAAGAAFLDEHDPDWWRPDVKRAIDLDELDLESQDSCVLGQRCPLSVYNDSPEWMGRYEAFGAQLSGRSTTGASDLDSWAVPLGFQALPDPDDDATLLDYKELTAEWKHVIAGRRAAA